MENGSFSRPAWLRQDEWRKLLQKYGDDPHCEKCGARPPTKLEVDHILARALGGENVASNLQFMCRPCNGAKSDLPDDFWKQRFYFDLPHHKDKFRVAQGPYTYDVILSNPDWFLRPFSEIAGYLYLLAHIIAAGKTLEPIALGFALNQLIRMHRPEGTPRVSHVLILAKDQAIRDGIASSLKTDVTKYGICNTAPRVRVVEDGDFWARWVENPLRREDDIVVTCVQQLWEKNDKPRKDLRRILATFPLIIFDENHYGREQILGMVEAAEQSICVGTTGSPINANGEAIQKFVLLSVFGWQEANDYDGSVKYIDDDDSKWSEQVEVIGINDAHMLHGLAERVTTTTEENGYDKALVPVMSVVDRTVAYVSLCDEQDAAPVEKPRKAAHRDDSYDPSLTYPVHSMIQVETIDIGIVVVNMLNAMFEANPGKYPPEKGYRAELVHSEISNSKGARVKGKPLTDMHPWMLAQRLERAPTAREAREGKWARFLVVVDIGREGVNNTFVGVVSIACHEGSVVSDVQRPLGRQARAFRRGKKVARARLDTVKIITHVAFRNEPVLKQAFSFVRNMHDHLLSIPTLEDLKAGLIISRDTKLDEDGGLTINEKLGILNVIGNSQSSDEPVDIDGIRQAWSRGSQKRADSIDRWTSTAIRDKPSALKEIHYVADINPTPVVIRERTTTTPTDEDLRMFTENDPARAELSHHIGTGSDGEKGLKIAYDIWIKQFHSGKPAPWTNVDEIRKNMGGRVLAQLGSAFIGDRDMVWKLASRAVNKKLGVPKTSKGGDLDIPQVHHLLTLPQSQREMDGWIRSVLIREGYCPGLSAALGISTNEYEDAAE